MGGHVPGPLGLHVRKQKDDGIVGMLRNVQKIIDSIGDARSIELDFVSFEVDRIAPLELASQVSM